MTIESPCTKVCVIEPKSGFCLGCGRTVEEIGGWMGYSPEHRKLVISGLPARLALLSEAPPQAMSLAVFATHEA
ncbi:MAG: DUF1289 domain-containing protein [Rhizobiaceae bacterium]|nr:DUF1289 domain-containing protein [Rhizobiaceae bacterium]